MRITILCLFVILPAALISQHQAGDQLITGSFGFGRLFLRSPTVYYGYDRFISDKWTLSADVRGSYIDYPSLFRSINGELSLGTKYFLSNEGSFRPFLFAEVIGGYNHFRLYQHREHTVPNDRFYLAARAGVGANILINEKWGVQARLYAEVGRFNSSLNSLRRGSFFGVNYNLGQSRKRKRASN